MGNQNSMICLHIQSLSLKYWEFTLLISPPQFLYPQTPKNSQIIGSQWLQILVAFNSQYFITCKKLNTIITINTIKEGIILIGVCLQDKVMLLSFVFLLVLPSAQASLQVWVACPLLMANHRGTCITRNTEEVLVVLEQWFLT